MLYCVCSSSVVLPVA